MIGNHTTAMRGDFAIVQYAPQDDRKEWEEVKGRNGTFNVGTNVQRFFTRCAAILKSIRNLDWMMRHKRVIVLHGQNPKGVGAVLATLCGGSRR